MNQIEELQQERELARQAWLTTGDKEYLFEMVTLKEQIDILKEGNWRVLARVLLALIIVAIVAPFIGYFFA